MFILQKPMVSPFMLRYLEETQAPVLHNAFIERYADKYKLNLLDDEAFREQVTPDTRIYINSEDCIEWIYTNLADMPIAKTIRQLKDKAEMRRKLKSLFPDYYFEEYGREELLGLDENKLPYPCVLKPSIGFFSCDVFMLESPEDFISAKQQIRDAIERGEKDTTVVSREKYLIEEMIKGTEYAVDMYFDAAGEPVILSIMEHRFSSPTDVRDRLYITSPATREKIGPRMTDFFRKANQKLDIRNLCMHVECREQNGQIIPIEFNSGRLCGLGNADLTYYAYGINPFECFLKDIHPDEEIYKAHAGHDYSFVQIEFDKDHTPFERFDMPAFLSHFSKVLDVRTEADGLPVYVIAFIDTTKETEDEMRFGLMCEPEDFLK